jgi:hypothetical protein
VDYRLLEQAAQEWESSARDLDDWRKKNMRKATWRSSREARSEARRLRRLLPLGAGIEITIVRFTRTNDEG